jgi:hypothetical protein
MKKSMTLNRMVCGWLLLLTRGGFAANKGSLRGLSRVSLLPTSLNPRGRHYKPKRHSRTTSSMAKRSAKP